jgi:hypothetical protein
MSKCHHCQELLTIISLFRALDEEGFETDVASQNQIATITWEDRANHHKAMNALSQDRVVPQSPPRDLEVIMKSLTRWMGFAVCGLLVGSSASGQDLLKQLEDKLRGKQPPVQEAAPATDPSENESVQVGEQSEELPMPDSASTASPVDPASTPSAAAPKRPKPPIVFFPKKKPDETLSPPAKPPLNTLPRNDLGSNPSDLPMEGGGYLGLTLEPVIGGGFGLAVVDVTPQSPAWKGGFRTGDRVVGVAGQAVTTMDQFAAEIEKYAPGSPIRFLVQRRGRSTNLVAVLQDRTLAGQLHGAQPGTALPLNPPVAPYQPIYGNAAPNSIAFLGVSVSDISETFRQQFGLPVYRGAAVSNVVVGSAAEIAGIRPGDCIVELDGRMINRAEDVVDAMAMASPGQSIAIGYFHGRQRITIQVPLVPGPSTRGGNPGILSPGANGFGNGNVGGVSPEMLTPEYVASLHEEVSRLQDELLQTQDRLRALEAQIQSPDRRR